MKTLSRRKITVAASILAVAALAGTPALAKDGSPTLGAAKMSHGQTMTDKMMPGDGAMMSDDKMMSDTMMKSADETIAPGKARYSKR